SPARYRRSDAPAPGPGPVLPGPVRVRKAGCHWYHSFSGSPHAEFEWRIGAGDDRPAQAGVAVVEHDRLAERDRTLGALEPHLQRGVLPHDDVAWLLRLPVPGLGGATEARSGRSTGDPVHGFGLQRRGVEPWRITALGNVQYVLPYVLADHVPRGGFETADTADVQALALAQGEVKDPW